MCILSSCGPDIKLMYPARTRACGGRNEVGKTAKNSLRNYPVNDNCIRPRRV